jgi:rubrerythrin
MTDTDRILKGLKQAMQAEIDGHNFYRMAADNTKDEMGKEAFKALAQDEVDHFKFLKAQYDSFKKEGKPDKTVKLGKPSNDGESPIFSDSFKARINEAHYEMTALSVGIQLELSAINFYNGEAEKISDSIVKSFYKELAEWETTHYHSLLKQQQELQEEYWQDGNFHPF